MKFLLIAFAMVGIAAAALPDSATQGPNPQDIATPEPEYIDIDLPEPPKPAPPAPIQRSSFSAPQRSFAASAPVQRTFSAPIQRQQFIAPHPVPQPITNSYLAPVIQHHQQQQQQHHHQQQQQQHHVSGHSYNSINGYQYKRPLFVRRSYYHRIF